MNPKIKLVVFDCFYTFSEGDGNKEEDVNLEDREAEKIANAILELRERNGIR